MRKILIVLSICCFAAFSAQASKKDSSKKNKKSKNEVQVARKLLNSTDSVSYALGVNMGTSVKHQMTQFPGGQYDINVFAEAFEKAIKSDTTLVMTSDSANVYLDKYMTKMQAQENSKAKEDQAKFLSENKKREGVVELPSGLQYQVVKAGTGPKPQLTDKVKVHYEGFLLNGKKFDSSVDRGEPVTFPLTQVIKGWTEGLQQMNVGSKYTLYIPYELAYGEQGAGKVIPPFSMLIFEVELLEIQK